MSPETKLALTLQVALQIACDDAQLPSEDELTAWAQMALQGKAGGELTIRLVDEAESQSLNAAYRDRHKPTNVLSFPFQMPEGLPAGALPAVLGDLVICASVVEREATEQHKQLQAHWAHMVVHGVLHLLGHDHQQEQEAEEMEALERQILARLGVADPYQPNEETGEV